MFEDVRSHFSVYVTDQKMVVNLSPAEHKKNGPLFDLAIGIDALKELNSCTALSQLEICPNL